MAMQFRNEMEIADEIKRLIHGPYDPRLGDKLYYLGKKRAEMIRDAGMRIWKRRLKRS